MRPGDADELGARLRTHDRRAASSRLVPPVLIPVVLVTFALFIVVTAVAWAWRHDTLHTTEQERTDIEFERIVRRLDLPTR